MQSSPLTRVLALYGREVLRFRKLWLDTVMSPVISTLLYLLVFGVVTGGRAIDGVGYPMFVYAGLMTMVLVNASFSNPSFALVIAKNTGTIIDLYLVPIKAYAIGLAYTFAAFTRAVLTVLFAMLLTAWFVPGFGVANPLYLLIGILLTSLTFGLLGVLFGAKAKNFEAMTFALTFVLQPMIFLSGAFYPIAQLPAPWNLVSSFNPLHHHVNLVRYGFTGYSDIPPTTSLLIASAIVVVCFLLMQVVVRKTLKAE